MNKMIGKTWKIRMDGELRTYEIVSVDAEGWIKIKRQGVKGSRRPCSTIVSWKVVIEYDQQ